jgi:hypothetical protein
MTKKKKLRGTVEKIITPLNPNEPDKAQINIKEADHLYQEIRIENALQDETGEKVSLKPGAEIDVVLEADSSATMTKPDVTGVTDNKAKARP